jgi:general stress protein 26
MEKSETRQKIYNFLSESPVCVLSTVNDDGTPYSTTIYIYPADDLSVYFLSKSETKKIENIKKNDAVMLVSYDAKSQTNIQVSGKATEVKDESSSKEIFAKIIEATKKVSGADIPPVSKLFAGYYVVYKVEPRFINYSVYNSDDLEMAVFETIEF